MKYKVNPLSLEELKLLARARQKLQHPIDSEPLSSMQAQRLMEDLAASNIELEIQNEYLHDAHTKLEQALGQWRELFDFAPVGCISVNEDRAITKSNLAAGEILGADRAALLQTRLDSYFCEQDRAALYVLLNKAAQTREPQRAEMKVLNEFATAQYVQIDVVSLVQGPGYQVILSDSTAEKNTEHRLREREERWKFALDTSADGIWDWNVANATVSYSDKLVNLYGYSVDEFGGTLESWRSRVHPDDQTDLTNSMQRCISGTDNRFSSEFRMLCKDGSWKWILCRGAVFSESTLAKAERVIGTHVDISGYKAMEASLRIALDTQMAAFHSIAHPMALLDGQGYVLHTNTAWKTHAHNLGCGRQLALSETLTGLIVGVLPGISAEVQQQVVAGILSVIDRSQAEFRIECSHASPNGERIILIEATPVVNGLARALVSHHDLTASLHKQDETLDGARFYQVAQTEFIRATRYRQPLMVLVLKLNYELIVCKQIDANTTALARDQILHLSRDELRSSDVIGSIGGDIYAVLLPNTEQDGGQAIALRIIDKVLASPTIGGGKDILVTVSIGASSLNGDATFASLLGRADNASLVAKQRGGNCLTVDTIGLPCLWANANQGERRSEVPNVEAELAGLHPRA